MPPMRSRDEVGVLGRSLSQMRGDLQRHVTELTEATAARQKIESELAVAHQIQLAMVPHHGDAIADSPSFRLAARLIPARAVGGDWYDYFVTGADQLVLVVGDVSDKGVPAALLMSKTVATIRSAAHHQMPPEKILEEANAEFCHDNDSYMFATIFCATLDLGSRELSWASAGHTPPLLRGTDGAVRPLESPPSLPIGLSPAASYAASAIKLEPGDTLILYTDGVTEAFGPGRELYGEDRLVHTLGRCGCDSPSELNAAVLGSVSDFANGADQSDDIALLSLKIPDPTMPVSRTFASQTTDTAALKRIRLDLAAFLEDHQVPQGTIDAAVTITAEVLDNLLEHAPAGVRSELRAELLPDRIHLEFADDGPAFDPLGESAEPDKEIGGHGLTIVKAMATGLRYERLPDSRNLLSAELRFEQNGGC